MAFTAEQRRAHRAKKRAQLLDELGGKCYDCGDARWWVLDAHHRDSSTTSYRLSGHGLDRSMDALRLEAEKCDLDCANCHRTRHYEELQRHD